MFAVVQHQQKLLGHEIVGESGLDRPPRLLPQIERRRHCLRQQAGFGERSQLHQPHPVLVVLEDFCRDLERHARFA